MCADKDTLFSYNLLWMHQWLYFLVIRSECVCACVSVHTLVSCPLFCRYKLMEAVELSVHWPTSAQPAAVWFPQGGSKFLGVACVCMRKVFILISHQLWWRKTDKQCAPCFPKNTTHGKDDDIILLPCNHGYAHHLLVWICTYTLMVSPPVSSASFTCSRSLLLLCKLPCLCDVIDFCYLLTFYPTVRTTPPMSIEEVMTRMWLAGVETQCNTLTTVAAAQSSVKSWWRQRRRGGKIRPVNDVWNEIEGRLLQQTLSNSCTLIINNKGHMTQLFVFFSFYGRAEMSLCRKSDAISHCLVWKKATSLMLLQWLLNRILFRAAGRRDGGIWWRHCADVLR